MVRIAIIGWWAAWMMVAATLAERTDWHQNPEIHIFEKNKELWTKVRISWWGRCNITTGYYKKQDLATKYTRWRDFLAHAMSQFWPRKMMQRCADHNCPIYCQDDMRCFPESNKGSDVVAMFEKILDKHNVQIHFEEAILSLATDGNTKFSDQKSINQIIEKQQHTPENTSTVEHISVNTLSNQPKTTDSSTSSFTLTTSKWTYEYDFVVITTWWNAYGHTGSTWDWYSLAQRLWHTITPLWPSLNSFLIAEEWIKECSGVSFQNAMLTSTVQPHNNNVSKDQTLSDRTTAQPSQWDISQKSDTDTTTNSLGVHWNIVTNNLNTESWDIDLQNISLKAHWDSANNLSKSSWINQTFQNLTAQWPMLLTHFGISWPATFSYSSQIPLIPISVSQPHTVLCRPYADRNYEWRLHHINETTAQHPKKQLLTLLSHHFPIRRCDTFCKAHDIDQTRYLGNLTREQKQSLANLLGNGFSLTLTARRPWDEFVTAWWISTNEINPKTMQSLLCPWLFFAGEVLNIDAVTWGFNFQSCWATGRCAGMGIK